MPSLIPGVGRVLKTLGVVAGASALTRMHLHLVLEIALLFDRDIDDPARVAEMVAIVGATAAAVTGPPIVLRALRINPLVGIAAAGLSATALTRLIGRMSPASEETPASFAAATVILSSEKPFRTRCSFVDALGTCIRSTWP